MDSSKYEKHFSVDGFWSKLKKYAKEAGLKVVYTGLLLFYALESPNTPLKAKVQIYGALGYLIFPFDIVPDLLPVVGYVDDLGALMLAVSAVAGNINQDVKQKARLKLQEFFGAEAADHQDVIDVEGQLAEEQDTKAERP